MSCPTPSESEINEMISKVDGLLSKATDTQTCDAECQQTRILDSLKTELDDSKDNYTTCESRHKSAEKSYIIQKYGINYYNNQQNTERKKNEEEKTQKMIDLFLKKLTETNSNFDTLKNDVDHLNLIQDLYKNTGVSKTLYDVFGISISPFEGFRTLSTINQEIKFSYNKNQIGKSINKVLYVIYYILCMVLLLYLFLKGKHDTQTLVIIAISILLLPLINIVKYVILFFQRVIVR